MKELPENTESIRMSALLSLASTKETKETKEETCPSTQQIALFIDGHLKKKTQRQLLAHMNHCSHCRNIWLETATFLESLPEKAETTITQKITQNIKDFLSPGPVFTGGIIAGGVSVALLLLVTLLPSSNINQQIDSRYQIISNQANEEVTSYVSTYTMPWDNAVLGFSKKINTAQQNAFGAGLWEGKNKMLATSEKLPAKLTPEDQKQWLQTDWANYYQLGRFVFLLWAETQLSTNTPDWGVHAKIATRLREELTQVPLTQEQSQALLLSINQVSDKIKILQNQPDISEKKALQRLLEIIMQNYSPG